MAKNKERTRRPVLKREAPVDPKYRASTGQRLAPVHPGDVLLHDFIEPMGLTRYRVAKSINVPQRRIDEICSGARAMSADTALRLERLFGMSAQAWLNLQAQYDLELAAHKLGNLDAEITPLNQAAA